MTFLRLKRKHRIVNVARMHLLLCHCSLIEAVNDFLRAFNASSTHDLEQTPRALLKNGKRSWTANALTMGCSLWLQAQEVTTDGQPEKYDWAG